MALRRSEMDLADIEAQIDPRQALAALGYTQVSEPRRVKINDHCSAYFARKIMKEHPEFADFFETRKAEGDD